jgi:1,4-alpha-glucan branching enzyme
MGQVFPQSLLTEYDIYLFKSGKHYKTFDKFGSKIITVDGVSGVQFTVWAPSAQQVSVIGNFNYWNTQSHLLFPRLDSSGIWEGFIAGIQKGDLYKYAIISAEGRRLEKGDPYACFWEIPPNTASVVWDLTYSWQDYTWLERRKEKARNPQPWSIYELHIGSWRKSADHLYSLSYKELAIQLVDYVVDMGFTHVEFLPVMEHPYFPSWGYQVTGYFAPSSRFGTPQDFMYLVDALHQAGIGVILDWVPSHFPTDAHGLAQFDGSHLYEHADPRQGFHPDWQSAIFNYGRNEVRNFLISNALYWMSYYHIDALRVDAVASMLYLDYSREEGQWLPNCYGGKENIEAIAFLREFNETVYREFPDTHTIAEESTAWSGVSKPTFTGGLGFGQKWMMGWMHDTLNYFKKDPIYRKHHHNQLTFSMVYGFTENFQLPLSHDEVVHGKGSLLNRMPGDEWQRFANLRLLFGYMYTHPGTKLLFMGGEFGQSSEWNIERGLDWWLLQFSFHQGVQAWVKALNTLYKEERALYEKQFEPDGFEWIDHNNAAQSVVSYIRKGTSPDDFLVIIHNFTPVSRSNFKLGVPFPGIWSERLNGDNQSFSGSGHHENKPVSTSEGYWNNHPQYIEINLPPLATVIFKKQG